MRDLETGIAIRFVQTFDPAHEADIDYGTMLALLSRLGERHMTAAQIARVVHEANRAYCLTQGDTSQLPWDEAPEWQRTSALAGIEAIRAKRVTAPHESHVSWLEEKQRDGWKYGPVKDIEKKEHPCFVPYEALPAAQKVKDYLFFGIVTTLLPHLTADEPAPEMSLGDAVTGTNAPASDDDDELFEGRGAVDQAAAPASTEPSASNLPDPREALPPTSKSAQKRQAASRGKGK